MKMKKRGKQRENQVAATLSSHPELALLLLYVEHQGGMEYVKDLISL